MLPDTLASLPFVERFFSFPELASTSDFARSLTELPRTGLFVIQADSQTKGRGRNGAGYFSPCQGGLWVTIITPVASIEEHFHHNRALSLSLCEAMESITGRTEACAIKWPNDIYWNGKKICGILLENHPKDPCLLVLGFGCNVSIKATGFPADLQSIATSLLRETGTEYPLHLLLTRILLRYEINRTLAPATAHEIYQKRLYGPGCPVEIEGVAGTLDGVEADGRLRLARGRELIYILSGHLHFTTAGRNR